MAARRLGYLLAAVLLQTATATAQDVADNALLAAYKKGFEEGYAECSRTPGCGGGFGIGRGAPGSVMGGVLGSAGSSSGFELPDALTNGDALAIPQNWYITPMEAGQGILGKVEPDGSFAPFVYRDGTFEFLPKEERPVWTTDSQFTDVIRALPKSDGLTVVPVQPSMSPRSFVQDQPSAVTQSIGR